MRTPIWHRLLVLLACLPATAIAADQAGVSAAVRGQVVVARAQAVGRAAVSGEPIFLQDKIESGTRSGMQILLLDQTTFTIGPESEIVVDEFVYDPKTSAGKLSAGVAKGVFRFVTGKIAKAQPSNMNVALPAGTIGIRGTIVAGTADASTQASLVVLLGEGPDNATGDLAGAIDVCNVGACTHVSRPGFGVRIDGPESPPSAAFRVGDDAVDSILKAVTGPLEGLDRELSDAREEDVEPGVAAGSDDAGKEAKQTRKRLESIDGVDALSDDAAQDVIADTLETLGKNRLPDGPSLFEQMKSIPSGQIHYAEAGVPLVGGGTYGLTIDVDFGAQTYGGGQSRFQVNGNRNGLQLITVPQSYANSSGPAQFRPFVANFITGAGCGTNCTATLLVFPQNSGGVIAGRALHNITVNDVNGGKIDGGAGNAPGLPGLSPYPSP